MTSTSNFATLAESRHPVVGVKQIGSLRLLLGGMLAQARFLVARSLIQSAS